MPCQNTQTAPTHRERVFTLDGQPVASLTAQGRIRITGQLSPSVPDFGYAVAHPSDRLLAALGALLAQDLRQCHGPSLREA